MHIPIPTGKNFTARVVGRAIREVKCENCGGDYIYVVQARATGQGSSPLFINEDGAKARAAEQANQRMQSELRGAYSAVYCPDCGWYQKSMLGLLRRARLVRWLLVASIPLIWLGLTWIFASTDNPPDLHSNVYFTISGALGVIAVAYCFTRKDNADPAARIARDPTCRGLAMRRADYEAAVANAKATQSGQTG